MIRRTYVQVMQALGIPDGMSAAEHFQHSVLYGLAGALRIPNLVRRLKMISVVETTGSNAKVVVDMQILPAETSPSPQTIFNMLARQLNHGGSALQTGQLRGVV